MAWMKDKERRTGHPDRTSPLRKVLGFVMVPVEPGHHIELREELYECGHTRLPKQDIIGETNAFRRRCYKCAKGIAPDSKYLKMAQEWEKE